MSEWETKKLGDFIKVKHGYAFKGKNITDEETDTILVTPGNFKIGGGFKSSKFKYFNSEYPEEYVLSEGDIVVTMTDLSKETDTLGYSAKIPSINGKVLLHNQRIGLVEFTDNEVSKDFIYWLMRTAEYQWYCLSSASGTSIMHTSPSRIEDYDIQLPPTIEQCAIASVLSSLDDKIDLLHRQNQTLEQMAETLFRQWFVPARAGDPHAGGEEADEGWEETTLYDAIELVGGGTPKTSIEEYWNGDIKWLSGGDIASNHKSIITSSEKTITEEGLNNSSAKLLPKFSTVISARGTVGKYCLLSEPMAYSQSNYGIKPKFKNCYFFTYLLVNHSVEELSSAAYGSVFDTITTATFKSLKVTLPEEKEIQSFEKTVQPYFYKILNNQKQISTLTTLRNNLLPKLMSGTVQVNI